MPLELNTMIVTKNKELRTDDENVYELVKDGYRLYPMDIPVLEVKVEKMSHPYALAKVNQLIWENGKTHIIYELVELIGVN